MYLLLLENLQKAEQIQGSFTNECGKKDTSRAVEKRHYILDRKLSTYFTNIGIL